MQMFVNDVNKHLHKMRKSAKYADRVKWMVKFTHSRVMFTMSHCWSILYYTRWWLQLPWTE